MQPKKAYKKKIPKKITESYLRNSGLFYLQRYVSSSRQFERAMKRKIDRSCLHHTTQDKEECYKWLEAVKQEFQELGYLNDSAYLRGMLQSLRISKGFSTRMIIMKMREKGFSEEDTLNGLNILDDDDLSRSENELNAADQFAKRKKLGPYHPTPARKTYDQQLSSLARAGFSYDICKKILGEDIRN